MEFKHDSYTGTSLEWRGFNPWAESFRRYQKNPKLCVGDLSVTLCVVSLLRGLKVGKEIETLAQDGWSFLGNLWDNSQCQLESLPCKKDCKSQFIEWQKKFPSRNWHTHRDGKIFWPWWLDVHLGLNLSFPFFFSFMPMGREMQGAILAGMGCQCAEGRDTEGWTFPEPGSFQLIPSLSTRNSEGIEGKKKPRVKYPLKSRPSWQKLLPQGFLSSEMI